MAGISISEMIGLQRLPLISLKLPSSACFLHKLVSGGKKQVTPLHHRAFQTRGERVLGDLQANLLEAHDELRCGPRVQAFARLLECINSGISLIYAVCKGGSSRASCLLVSFRTSGKLTSAPPFAPSQG